MTRPPHPRSMGAAMARTIFPTVEETLERSTHAIERLAAATKDIHQQVERTRARIEDSQSVLKGPTRIDPVDRATDNGSIPTS